jgi:hypothetical protein
VECDVQQKFWGGVYFGDEALCERGKCWGRGGECSVCDSIWAMVRMERRREMGVAIAWCVHHVGIW